MLPKWVPMFRFRPGNPLQRYRVTPGRDTHIYRPTTGLKNQKYAVVIRTRVRTCRLHSPKNSLVYVRQYNLPFPTFPIEVRTKAATTVEEEQNGNPFFGQKYRFNMSSKKLHGIGDRWSDERSRNIGKWIAKRIADGDFFFRAGSHPRRKWF